MQDWIRAKVKPGCELCARKSISSSAIRLHLRASFGEMAEFVRTFQYKSGYYLKADRCLTLLQQLILLILSSPERASS
jgi:hypothetical protein